MPKMKTRKAVAKRFQKTKSGKFKRAKANRRHILTGKPQDRMRRLRRHDFVHKSEVKRVARMLPYS